MERVSWDDAVRFCDKLSALPEEQAAGRTYRLPTEAEWEYACRAGTTTRFSFGDDSVALGTMHGLRDNSDPGDASGGREASERLGPLRHARQRVGVVRGLVRRFPISLVDDPSGPATGFDACTGVVAGTTLQGTFRRSMGAVGVPSSIRDGSWEYPAAGLPVGVPQRARAGRPQRRPGLPRQCRSVQQVGKRSKSRSASGPEGGNR